MLSVLSVLAVVLKERRIGATAIFLAQLALPTYGFYVLQSDGGSVQNGWLVLAAPAIFAVGALCVSGRSRSDTLPTQGVWLGIFLRNAFLILGALAIAHYSAIGITLLNPSVETSRFDIGSSGGGGLPSRAVMYAIPALALLSLATLSRKTRRVTASIWVLYSLSQVAMGFKGALIEVLLVAAIGYVINVYKPRSRDIVLFSCGLVGALLYVQFVGSKYGTFGSTVGGVSYILDRSTTEAIRAGYSALSIQHLMPAGSAFIQDLDILLARYTGARAADAYTFDSLISSVVTGTALRAGNFIVPVTVGGAVYLLFSAALPIVIVILVTLGFIWGKMIWVIRRPETVVTASAAAVLIYGIRIFMMNGGGAYLLINLSFTFIMLLLCSVPGVVHARLQPSRPSLIGNGCGGARYDAA